MKIIDISDIFVSVIMSTYNESSEYLVQSIESILEQTHKNLEFIVIVDNPNNINAISLLKQYKDMDSRITVVINEKNIGLVGSLNKALRLCKGQFIVRMDADDISDKDRIDRQLRYMLENDIDILGGGVETIDKNGSIRRHFSDNINGVNRVKEVLTISNIIPHPTWIVKKDVYLKLNGYRDIYTCEDYDFLLRAIQENYRVDNLNECVLKYRYIDQSISRSNALTQFLTMKSLQKNYKGNFKESFPEKNKGLTTEKEIRFLNANKKILIASENFSNKKIIKSIIHLFEAIMLSPYSLIKIKDIIWIRYKYRSKI